MFGKSGLSTPILLTLSAGLIATGAAFPPASRAQEMIADDEQVVVVTGSRIRRIQQEGPSPVVTITAEDMASRGYTTVLEALTDLSQNAGGGINHQNLFGFAHAASAIDLRGFGIGRSLVLIDGRRVPVFPLAEGGTTNFVDLSSIPAVAIDRIEVLTDSASAIYGSDAVGGVVNVILRKDTQAGNELSLRRDVTTAGGGGQTRAQLATGFANANGGNALLFLEYYKQDVLAFTDRDYSRSDLLGGIDGPGEVGGFSAYGHPGSFFDPFDDAGVPMAAGDCDTSSGVPAVDSDVGICFFNRSHFRTLLPEIERYSATAKYERPLSASLAVFGRLSYLTSTVETRMEPMALGSADDLGIVLTADAPNNPTNPAVDTADIYPQNISGAFVRRLVEFGPRRSITDNDTVSALAGLRGTFGKGNEWESAVGYTEQKITDLNTGYARMDAFFEAICGPGGVLPDGFSCNTGTLNLFEPIPQDIVEEFGISPRTHGVSSIAAVDFSMNGDLFSMTHGPARYAFITEFNRQRFEDRRDPQVLAGNVIALGATAGGGDRKYYAAGLEVELPVLEKLAVNLAGRFDQYDDASNVGGAFSPRLGLHYRPFNRLLLRATAGKSFRAPDLQRLFGAEVTGFLELIDTPTCVALGGEKDVPLPGLPANAFDPCTDVVQSVEVREGANRDLREESGENYSAGVVWEPTAGLTLAVDVFYSELADIVNTPNQQIMLDKNAETGAFDDAITHDPADVTAVNPGGLDVVSAQARNLSLQRTRGVNVAADQRLNIGTAGALQLKLNATYLDELAIRELTGDPLLDVLSEGALGEKVRFKGNAGVNWTRGPVSATAFLNHVGSFVPLIPGNQDRVGSWTTVNLSGGYDLPWKGRIQLGCNNIFDRDPPIYTAFGGSSQPFYNLSFHDAYGSTWYLNYSQKF